jgi:cellulose biosynthesis protein BcsQ
MFKRISLFNHKGGVSKTTTAFNLGWMLASKGKRILLVDCDPQCNLTGMVLGFKGAADLQKLYTASSNNNIRDGLAPAFESRPSPIEASECIQVTGQPNMFLLPGHIGLAEYEVTLGIAQELSGSLPTLQNLPGALSSLITKTAGKYKADYVIVDMSPSLGPINQNILTTSDFFIVPMNPDYFSVMAIDSLASVLPRWGAWAEKARNLAILASASYPFPKVEPKFLGTIVQKYRPRGGGTPAKAFQSWIDEIDSGVKNKLYPALRTARLTLPLEKYERAGLGADFCIAQMADFNGLIAVSQKHQMPVFKLTDKQLAQGGVILERTKTSMHNFRKLFSEAAQRIIKLIDG